MQGYSPKLPLTYDNIDGPYSMNKTALETIKQDLKMLLLTNQGEKMMDPNYGVGLRSLLFSLNTQETEAELAQRVADQVSRYMSFVIIKDIIVSTPEQNENMIYVNVIFFIPSMNKTDQLNLGLASN